MLTHITSFKLIYHKLTPTLHKNIFTIRMDANEGDEIIPIPLIMNLLFIKINFSSLLYLRRCKTKLCKGTYIFFLLIPLISNIF